MTIQLYSFSRDYNIITKPQNNKVDAKGHFIRDLCMVGQIKIVALINILMHAQARNISRT